MSGVAAEGVLTLLAVIILLPLALVAMVKLDGLDAEDEVRTNSSQRAEGRTWPQRAATTLQWIIPGVLLAAIVGLAFPDERIWAAIALYVACNLAGTLMLFRGVELGQRGIATAKALFVFQIPLGALFLFANGL